MAEKYAGVKEKRKKLNVNVKSRTKSSFNQFCLHDTPTETNSLTLTVLVH